ncbi:probable leucine-rich repeat receptor-like protein kinase IMK3 [Selaginella moellendorffii]|nr:probable leucine-rich repeat receptor-like protein kinase IMK3 [Selaginella moellendorffii]|eukprot:XP_002976291.2 probable leucine-rich repeat receptor-like protein kinase IMK3 [Selaginella moellendorffii]
MTRRRGFRFFLLAAMWVFFFFSLAPNLAQDDGDGGGGGLGAEDGMIVTEENLAALLAIKHAFMDAQGALISWNETGVGACSGSWAGIKCARGQVIAVQLPGKGLGGSLSPRFGELTELRKLNLHSNRIEGSIPSSITGLANLRSVYLFQNRLTGTIPAGLGRSPLMQAVDLSGNRLQGDIPASLGSSGRMFLLNLAGNNLSGGIPPEIAGSASLITLILARNGLDGEIPTTWPDSGKLRTLDLSRNNLSGEIPPSIARLRNLTILDVASNELSGGIPGELGGIAALQLLDLSGNRLNGSIPASIGQLGNLTSANFSDNNLSGRVPRFVHGFNSSAFAGNAGLCGLAGLVACQSPVPSRSPQQSTPAERRRSRSRLSKLSLICIIVGGVLALGAAICMLMLIAWRFREQRAAGAHERASKGKAETSVDPSGGSSGGGAGGGGGGNGNGGNGKLVHFDGPFSFTADDLLCATAEVMGKSTYGTVYKATLENGNTVVVKRLREGIVRSQREFEAEVSALGRIRHTNLVALRAYYWGPKDEKLLVFDFMHGGSLAAFLHARGPETPLGWSTRMKIALGTAKGLAYLHDAEKMVHGNLTSSNILLDSHLNAVISDYGLSRLMTSSAGSNVLATAGSQGYRAPEVSKLKKATTKSDVYSFGIVLLELLTGKAPGDAVSTADGGALDLPEWVSSVVKEEWTSEVFDVELLKGTAPSEDDMLNTLQLAMNCVSASPSSRPDMNEVLRQVESVAGGGGSAGGGGDPTRYSPGSGAASSTQGAVTPPPPPAPSSSS